MLSDEKKQRLRDKFKVETLRHLADLRENLPRLVDAPGDRETLKAMVFSCHTIKGNLGMMRLLDDTLPALAEVADHLELTITELGNGTLQPEPAIFSSIEQGICQLEAGFLE